MGNSQKLRWTGNEGRVLKLSPCASRRFCGDEKFPEVFSVFQVKELRDFPLALRKNNNFAKAKPRRPLDFGTPIDADGALRAEREHRLFPGEERTVDFIGDHEQIALACDCGE